MGLFNKQHSATSQSSATTVIAAGCQVNGEFQLSGDVHVDGELRGKIISQGMVVIGPSGRVDGEIEAKSLIVNGVLEGSCSCESLEILPKGKVIGEASTKQISIERGGILQGYSRTVVSEIATNKAAARDVKASLTSDAKLDDKADKQKKA